MLEAISILLLANAGACFSSPDERAAILQLDENHFDLYDDQGWRLVASRGEHCNIPAAELILDYLEQHGEESFSRTYLLHWHAGQQFAFAGETRRAARQFRLSYVWRVEDTELTAAWNEYVAGSIAFLEGDLAGLVRAQAATPHGPMTNRDVLDGLLNCFDRPYRVAYGRACREP